MKRLPIVSAVERMAERKGVKLLMLGKSGIGKTSRLKDLDPATTLFLDIEAGDLAVADWPGDAIRPASWPESRDFFVFLAGPDKSLPPESAFSQAHYDHVIEKFGDAAQLDRYQTFFLDSITQLSRQCRCRSASLALMSIQLRPSQRPKSISRKRASASGSMAKRAANTCAVCWAQRKSLENRKRGAAALQPAARRCTPVNPSLDKARSACPMQTPGAESVAPWQTRIRSMRARPVSDGCSLALP